VPIVIAVQSIPRGGQVLSGAVSLYDWPAANLPPDVYTDPGQVLGKFAVMDITRGLPVMRGMVAETLVDLGPTSRIPLAIERGKVAVAFPLRSTYPTDKENLPYDRRDKEVIPRVLSVAYAAQPGDRVDVLACLWIYEIDKDFQSRLPNKVGYIDPQNPGKPVEGMPGRPTVVVGGLPGVEGPSEPQLPRMVCQYVVQDLRVLGVGDWSAGALQPAPTPRPPQGGQQPTPTPAPPVPQVMTLEAYPQDAVVIKYLREVGAQLDLALRSQGDKGVKFTTEAVNIQYVFERYKISIPPKLDYTVTGGGGVVIVR